MINEIEPQGGAAVQIQRVNLARLHPSPTNPRKHFDEKGLAELAASIEEHGIKTPTLARPSKTEPGQLEIVAGERRYRATMRVLESLAERGQKAEGAEAERLNELYAQRSELPVIVEDLDDAMVLELQLIENLQRKDLTPLEEARGYQNLLDLKEKDYTPQKIAQKIGKSVDTVLRKLRMLTAPKEMLEALEKGLVSEAHLVQVASVPGIKARAECAKQVLAGEYDWHVQADRPLSVRETVALINREYRQTLKGAPWDLEDAALVATAGPCASCPHFAKHAAMQDAELAAELGNGRGQTDPLTCMNPACYKQKQEAVWRLKKKEAKDGEVVVLKKQEAEEIVNEDGRVLNAAWVRLDGKLGHEIMGHYDEAKMPSWREVVEDRLTAGAVHVANTERGGIVELVKRKDAIEAGKAHKKHGKLFAELKPSGKKELTAAEKKAKEKEAFDKKVDQQARICLLQHLYERALEKGMDAEGALAVLDTALHESGMDGCRLMCQWLSLEPTALHKNQSAPGQENYREALILHLKDKGAGKPEIEALIMIAQVAKWVKNWGIEFASLAPLQKHFGFDKKTIIALATADVQAELDAKKKPEKPEKHAEKNSTDPVDVSADKEADKTEAADKIAKDATLNEAAVEDGVEPITCIELAAYRKHALAGTWTAEDVEQLAAEIAAERLTIPDILGTKPNRKEVKALKKYDAARVRLIKAVKKLGK